MKKLFFQIPVITLFISLVLIFQAFADTTAFPRLEPAPEAEYFAGSFEPRNWRSQVSLALWASGDSDGADETIAALQPIIAELISYVEALNDRDKAEKLLELMHETFLKAYSLKQTRLDTLLQTGRYNCVSSAVLYAILGTASGLDISGVSTLDHAFCSVNLDDRQADVETTSPYGFEPGTKTEFHDAFGKTTGFAYVPPRNYRDRTSVELLALFSLILSNRISDAEAAGNHPEAVGLAIDRWVLLGRKSNGAYEDLVDRMINYGVYLAGKGRETEALAWVEAAVAAYGNHPKWSEFIDSSANNLVVKLLRRGLTEDARARFEELKPRLSEAIAANLDLNISDTELLDALGRAENGGPEEDFLTAVSGAEAKGILPPERIREVKVVWSLRKIEQIARTEGWAAAYKETLKAIEELGFERQLENALRVYRSNRIAEMYNYAADAYNSGDYDRAVQIVEEALNEFPEERRLLNLRTAAEKALSASSQGH